MSGSEDFRAAHNYNRAKQEKIKMKIWNKEMGRRLAMSFSGTIIMGLCVGGLQKANLGVDPFTCLVTGMANLFRSEYNTFYIIVTGILLILAFFFNRKLLGVATVMNLLIVGYVATFMKNTLNNLFPSLSMGGRIVVLIISLVIVCMGTSLYFVADLGVSSYDAVALTISEKCKRIPFQYCRITTDILCVVTGFVFHVTVGIGTVITAFMMGPVIQWFNVHLSEPIRYGRKKES